MLGFTKNIEIQSIHVKEELANFINIDNKKFFIKSDFLINQNHFSELISKKSKIQVINLKDQKELKNYFKKNLLEDEMVICMGAGSISNWIREISNESK